MGSPKHLSTTPSEGFGPSRRQTTLRSPSEAHFKQPLREDGFQNYPVEAPLTSEECFRHEATSNCEATTTHLELPRAT